MVVTMVISVLFLGREEPSSMGLICIDSLDSWFVCLCCNFSRFICDGLYHNKGSFNLEDFPFLGSRGVLFGCLLKLDGFGSGSPDITADVERTPTLSGRGVVGRRRSQDVDACRDESRMKAKLEGSELANTSRSAANVTTVNEVTFYGNNAALFASKRRKRHA